MLPKITIVFVPKVSRIISRILFSVIPKWNVLCLKDSLTWRFYHIISYHIIYFILGPSSILWVFNCLLHFAFCKSNEIWKLGRNISVICLHRFFSLCQAVFKQIYLRMLDFFNIAWIYHMHQFPCNFAFPFCNTKLFQILTRIPLKNIFLFLCPYPLTVIFFIEGYINIFPISAIEKRWVYRPCLYVISWIKRFFSVFYKYKMMSKKCRVTKCYNLW